MIDWRTEFDEAIQRVVSYTDGDSRTYKEYLPGIELLPREMHMIETIINHPGLNTTGLSALIGLQKGVVSKITRDLEKRGIIARYQEKDNLKEVHYQSTSLGKRLYAAHIQYHKNRDFLFYDYFDRLAVEKKAFLIEMLCRYADYMKSYCEEKQRWSEEKL